MLYEVITCRFLLGRVGDDDAASGFLLSFQSFDQDTVIVITSYSIHYTKLYDAAIGAPPIDVPKTASLDRYAVAIENTIIDENVLVAQRAYLENCTMGIGANAQENCFIINSNLQGNNVMAHGSKVVETELEKNIFVGFNSFLVGKPDCRISIGTGSIVMPHTIIDCEEPLTIPPETLLWGLITNKEELKENSIALEDLKVVHTSIQKGNMHFEGEGASFVEGFKHRINHILESNGAFYHQHNSYNFV